VADGAFEGSVDQIISLPEGSENTDFRYCSREHLIFTHKLAHSGPKYCEDLFIYLLMSSLLLLILHYLFNFLF